MSNKMAMLAAAAIIIIRRKAGKKLGFFTKRIRFLVFFNFYVF